MLILWFMRLEGRVRQDDFGPEKETVLGSVAIEHLDWLMERQGSITSSLLTK